MSFYLGATLQLFARPWDKLYHVLVTPEFESNPNFYYKPKKNTVIDNRGSSLNTDDAEVLLAELPIIRLREKLSLGEASFNELVKEGQREIDTVFIQPELRISFRHCSVQIGEKTVRLQPLHMMIYAAYLRHKLNHCRHPQRPYCHDCTDCFPQLLDLTTKAGLEEMAKDYRQIAPSRVSDLLHRYKEGLTMDTIMQVISKIKKTFAEQLQDESLAAIYMISTSHRGYSTTRHGVRAEKSKIKIDQSGE